MPRIELFNDELLQVDLDGSVPDPSARPNPAPAASADWDEMDWDVDAWQATSDEERWDRWDVAAEPVARRPRHIDPLIARLGALAVIVTIAVPIVVGFTSGSSSEDTVRGVVTAAQDSSVATIAEILPTAETSAVTEPATASSEGAVASTGDTDTDSPASAPEPATTPATAALDAAEPPATATAATPPPTPPATADPCGSRYELSAGDYWIRIADAAGVRLADLLAVNGATVDTVLVPGRTICLPVGASTPAPPAPPSTGTTATTKPPSTTAAPPTTARPAPTTTAAPTTTVRPATPSEVEAIIRDVWPDDLEERALEIAWRESNHIPTAKNFCCYGLFQIHWTAHRSWLAGIGVTSSSQLLDARTNTQAAYVLYQRSGGFGPWGG